MTVTPTPRILVALTNNGIFYAEEYGYKIYLAIVQTPNGQMFSSAVCFNEQEAHKLLSNHGDPLLIIPLSEVLRDFARQDDPKGSGLLLF